MGLLPVLRPTKSHQKGEIIGFWLEDPGFVETKTYEDQPLEAFILHPGHEYPVVSPNPPYPTAFLRFTDIGMEHYSAGYLTLLSGEAVLFRHPKFAPLAGAAPIGFDEQTDR